MTTYTDLELHEAQAHWQQQDEELNLACIFKHELETVEPHQLGDWFRSELKRRGIGND